jgi:hypothetical protein
MYSIRGVGIICSTCFAREVLVHGSLVAYCKGIFRVLLSGVLGSPNQHEQGLRQGGPLFPLFFDIAIDPLCRLGIFIDWEGLVLSQHLSFCRWNGYLHKACQQRHDNLACIMYGFGEVTSCRQYMVSRIRSTVIYPIQTTTCQTTMPMARAPPT